MIKTIRKPGRIVDFNSKPEQVMLKGSNEIKEKFSEIKTIVNRIKNIRSKLKKKKIRSMEEKKLIDEKKEKTRKMINLWNSLRRTDLNGLRKEELIKIINSQKNFIDDILEY